MNRERWAYLIVILGVLALIVFAAWMSATFNVSQEHGTSIDV